MPEKKLDLLQGTLDLMVLQTLASGGAQHGYGIARRIEQASGDEVLLKQGTIYGRWYDADSHPHPKLLRVPLDKLRDHFPADTPVVTADQRAEELRRRVRAAQRRRRW